MLLHSCFIAIFLSCLARTPNHYLCLCGLPWDYLLQGHAHSWQRSVINVHGQKWFWDFQYPNGKKFGGKNVEFVVPVNKPVQLVLTARDVLHSFFIPAMRVKKDAVPGMFSYINFTPDQDGHISSLLY